VRSAAAGLQFYALVPDIEARGLQGRIIDGISLIDYAGFVDLVTTHRPVQSWL
jgi:tRNA 2-thiouridine synthesizing protein B